MDHSALVAPYRSRSSIEGRVRWGDLFVLVRLDCVRLIDFDWHLRRKTFSPYASVGISNVLQAECFSEGCQPTVAFRRVGHGFRRQDFYDVARRLRVLPQFPSGVLYYPAGVAESAGRWGGDWFSFRACFRE